MADEKSYKPSQNPRPTPTPVPVPKPGEPSEDPTFPEGTDRTLFLHRLSKVDPDKVEPGPGPLQGSPNPSDPTKLANPNNPNSPVTGSANPSNPALPPAFQSDKPLSETRVLNEVVTLPVDEEAKKKKEEMLKKIGELLAKFNHRESEVPASSEYWSLLAQYRML